MAREPSRAEPLSPARRMDEPSSFRHRAPPSRLGSFPALVRTTNLVVDFKRVYGLWKPINTALISWYTIYELRNKTYKLKQHLQHPQVIYVPQIV
jgi:hypothetical protein